MFFVQNEDEASLTKMIEIFKNLNPSWVHTKTVLTDKDLTERLVFKNEMPQINLQICLFHVLRTFSREVTISKMNITESQRLDILQELQDITYSRSRSDFEIKVKHFLDNAPNQLVKSYFQKNWLSIKEEWVLCFRHNVMNLGENTTNRLESFFGKLKEVIRRKKTMYQLIEDILEFIESMQQEKSFKSIRMQTSKPTSTPKTSLEVLYQDYVTEFALKLLTPQFLKVDSVQVIDYITVHTQDGPIFPNNDCCTCSFFCKYNLPCCHMIALEKFNKRDVFLKSAIAKRWTKNYNMVSGVTQNRKSISIHQKKQLFNKKFRKVDHLLKNASSSIAELGMQDFLYKLK